MVRATLGVLNYLNWFMSTVMEIIGSGAMNPGGGDAESLVIFRHCTQSR